MSDDRREAVKLLHPEVSPSETAAELSFADLGSDFAGRRDETPRVDQQHLINLKSTLISSPVTAEAFEKDQVLAEIEDILAENLGEIYLQLPEDQRAAFKAKGEEVARKINTMVATAKVKVHQILRLINEWLQLIPGVNVYFLQQEAKIKLDKVMDYAESQAKSSADTL